MFHPPPVSEDLRAALKAAWGQPPQIERPADACCAGSHPIVSPIALEPLGHQRFALIVKQTSAQAAHAEAGWTSVAYLERRRRNWRTIRTWPNVAAAGESGGGNMSLQVRHDFGRTPLLLVRGSHTGQGYLDGTMVVVRLEPNQPKALGRIPVFASYLEPDSGELEHFSYRSTLMPARAPAVFDVRYVGWRQSSAGAPKRPFNARVRFSIRNGCLAIETPMTLPGERRSPVPEDCPNSEVSP